MANARRGNLQSVTTTGILTSERNQRVQQILLTVTTTNGVLVIQDPLDSTAMLDLRAVTAATTHVFDFPGPGIIFPNGLKVSTLTNCTAMIVYNNSSGSI